MITSLPISVEGFLKIYDPISKEVFVDKHNAIHYENFSLAIVNSFRKSNIRLGYKNGVR